MNIKKILFLFFICGAANAHNIDPAKCNNEIQQGDVYWCLMDKYQQSVIALKKEEINAQKRLEIFDNNEGKKRGLNEDGTLAYDSNIHLARITPPNFIVILSFTGKNNAAIHHLVLERFPVMGFQYLHYIAKPR